MASNEPPLQEGLHYYRNEAGLITFTATFLRLRGYCCGRGCRHCPYDYEAVPEPRRTKLLEERKNKPNSDG